MGTWITHLRIAENLLSHFPGLDETTFAFGNLSPDSGIPNEDWTSFDPPREVTHFLQPGEGEHEIHDLVYYQQYLADIRPGDDLRLYSFRLGYFFHLICDLMWAKRIVAATRHQFKDLFERDERQAVGLVKDDWYGLDQLYVRDHPEHIFWRVIMTQPSPPSYLPFVQEKALHHQYNHIRKFYSDQEDKWFLSIPYRYLNDVTMTHFIEDCVRGILIIQEKVQTTKSWHGLESSASLLPEDLIAPYQEPMGN